MSPLDVLRSAWRGVTANPLRSILTMLGVLIGVASVILLLAVGNGSAQQIRDAIDSLGTKTLTVRSIGQGSSLTIAHVAALQSAGLGHVGAVVPQVSSSVTVAASGGSEDSVSLIGTTPEYFDVTTARLASGSGFDDADVAGAEKVVVLGSSIASSLFSGQSALGQTVKLDGTTYTVVGVLASQSSTGISDSNAMVVAPISRVQRSFTGFNAVSTITIEATDADHVGAAQAEVELILDQLLGVGAEDTAPYRVTDQSSLLETQEASAQSFTVLLGAVAAISLLVGGIGVTNVMLVTVTERTREIGIRKALGATRRAVLGQFLVEAALLTLGGGVIGVLLALLGAQYEINGTQPVLLGWSIPLALGVSVAIGLFFGAYPAARAAAMKPIDALRSV